MELFETVKLYYGFPVYIIGYEDDKWEYNISTGSSSYTLGNTLSVGIYRYGNAMKQIKNSKKFSINIPNKNLENIVIEAGSSSGTNKLKNSKLNYKISDEYNVPILTDCMLSIICEVKSIEEYDNYGYILSEIKERYLSNEFINDNRMNVFNFNPVYFMGDEHQRYYRYLNDEIIKDER